MSSCPMVLLTASDVCEQLHVSRPWLYRAAREGRIPSVRLGGDDGPVRFVQADLDAWLEDARHWWQPGQSTAETLRRASDPREA
jgi:excisionase family DNA binding protein